MAVGRETRRRIVDGQKPGKGGGQGAPTPPRGGRSCCLIILIIIVLVIAYAYIDAYIIEPQRQRTKTTLLPQIIRVDYSKGMSVHRASPGMHVLHGQNPHAS